MSSQFRSLLVYAGEEKCSKCDRKAYYFECAGPIYCGRCAPEVRERLPRLPERLRRARLAEQKKP